jgi:hypothetical protein
MVKARNVIGLSEFSDQAIVIAATLPGKPQTPYGFSASINAI